MLEHFFETYSLTQIIIFIILSALAVKEFINLIDWFLNRGEKYFKNKNKEEDKFAKYEEEIKALKENQEKMSESINKLSANVELLIDSDKDDIKSFITKEYHYFVEQKGWIDKFSFDCIEKRFNHYRDEGGNSFIEDLNLSKFVCIVAISSSDISI